jgi:hypothetical protein
MVREARALKSMRIGTIHSLLVGVVVDTPTISDYEEQERVEEELLHRLEGKKCCTFFIIKRVTSPGNGEVREKARQMAETFKARVLGSAIAITASGVQAVIARGFLGAFALIISPEPPMRTFRSVADGVTWLRSLPGQDAALVADAQLVASLETFAAETK